MPQPEPLTLGVPYRLFGTISDNPFSASLQSHESRAQSGNLLKVWSKPSTFNCLF